LPRLRHAVYASTNDECAMRGWLAMIANDHKALVLCGQRILCLRTFSAGKERRTLFTYDPFDGVESLPLPGPVFIHAEACERYPEDAGYPAQLQKYPTTFNAYAKGRRLVAQEYVADGNVNETIQRLFLHGDVDYIHARNPEAGCYGFRIERAGVKGADGERDDS